jgi:hypothetical protein
MSSLWCESSTSGCPIRQADCVFVVVITFQRVAGNAHELDGLNAGLRKIQARLSATEEFPGQLAQDAFRQTVTLRK